MKPSHLVIAVPMISLLALHLVDRRRHATELEELRQTLGDRSPPAGAAAASAQPLGRWAAPRPAAAAGAPTPPPPSPGPAAEAPRPPALEVEEVRAHFEDSFAKQPPDVRWADEARRTAETRLSAVLPGTSRLQALECRSSMCRIETVHQGADGYRQFVQAAFMTPETRLWNGGFFAAQLGEPADGKVVTVAYLAREGEELPAISDVR